MRYSRPVDAVAELEALRGKEDQAEQHARGVTEAQRAATRELKAARTDLAQEEAGGTAKQVEAARQRFEAARRRVEEPWRERAQVAQVAIRDAHKAVAAFVRENLLALLAVKEAEGEAAAARKADAARAEDDARRELSRIGNEIASLWLLVTPPLQGDVSGEPPRLDRARMAELGYRTVEEPEPVPA
jgi:hypothetical protein